MKKLLALTLAMVLALFLAACSGNKTPSGGGNNTSSPPASQGSDSTPKGSDSTPGGSDNNPANTDGKLTMSITIPDGWTERERGDGTLIYEPADVGTYPNTFVMLYVEDNWNNLGGREYVEKRIEDWKEYDLDESEFSGVGDVTAAGEDAFYCTVHRKRGDTFSRYYYVFNGEDVYVFQGTIQMELMDELDGYLGDMFDSWTLK